MEYNVLVEFDELSDDEAERLLDEMQFMHPSLGWCPAGRPRVTVTVDGSTLLEAASMGVTALQMHLERLARSVEVLPTADFDVRYGMPLGE